MGYTVKYKRIHDEPEPDDGARVLVDPILPKEKSDDTLGLDEWYGKAAPSIALRKALRQEDIDFEKFKQNYRNELNSNKSALTPLLEYARQRGLTLLSAAAQPQNSFLPVLQQAILDALHDEDEQADGNEPHSPVCYDR